MNLDPSSPLERTAGKQAEYQAEAEEAREAAYQSPLRRLIGRLRRRSDDLPGQDGADADTPPGQFRQL